MIDPQKLLGGLLETATRQGLKGGKKLGKGMSGGGGLGGLLGANKGAIGMGLLGLAIGAFEHFSQNKAAGAAQSPFGGSPPPLPPQSPGGALPSATTSLPGSPPPPPPFGSTGHAPTETEDDTILLMRAMISAANADYSIDESEKRQILEKFNEANLSAEERDFLLKEFDNPLGISEITAKVKNPQMAEQVYAVSLIATGADTDVEKNYLKNLARRLDLSDEVIRKWHEQLEMNA